MEQLQAWLLSYANELSQQVSGNVCELKNGGCLPSTFQISHENPVAQEW